MPRILTDRQYAALLALFHECHEDFLALPAATLEAFYNRLYDKS